MIKYLWKGNRLLFVIQIALLLGVAAGLTYIPKAIGDIVDKLIYSQDVDIFWLLAQFLLTLVLIWCILVLCYTLNDYLVNRRKKLIEMDLAKKLITKLRSASAVTNIYNQEIEIVNRNYLSVFLQMTQVLGTFVFAVVIGLTISWKITLAYMGGAILLTLFTQLFSKKLSLLAKAGQDSSVAMNGIVSGIFAVLRTINIYCAKTLALTKLDRFFESKRKRFLARDVYGTFVGQLNNILNWIMQYGLIIMGYIFVRNGMLNIGQVTSLVLLNDYFANPIFSFIQGKFAIDSTREIRNGLEKFLNEPEDSVTAELLSGDIRFNGVSFNYTDDTFMSDLNLTFEHGKRYMIVGQSGSGKSTLLKLMLKELSPASGAIIFGSVNIADINPQTWYKNIAYTSQKVEIIPGTLRENIVLGKTYDAIKFNTIISLLNLEYMSDKFDEQLNEDMSNFSGGELQRITIARMLYDDSPIFIFDEFSSALDNINAYQVERELLKIEDKLLISVTHRLQIDLLESYDKIIIMERGRVKCAGSPSELVEDLKPFLLGD